MNALDAFKAQREAVDGLHARLAEVAVLVSQPNPTAAELEKLRTHTDVADLIGRRLQEMTPEERGEFNRLMKLTENRNRKIRRARAVGIRIRSGSRVSLLTPPTQRFSQLRCAIQPVDWLDQKRAPSPEE